jgi:hypothetical protein
MLDSPLLPRSSPPEKVVAAEGAVVEERAMAEDEVAGAGEEGEGDARTGSTSTTPPPSPPSKRGGYENPSGSLTPVIALYTLPESRPLSPCGRWHSLMCDV